MSAQRNRSILYLFIIASMLAGLFTGRAFLFNLSLLGFGIFFVALIWSWVSVQWIQITRKTHAHRIQVGRHLQETFAIHNTWLFPKLGLEVYDHSNFPGHVASHIVHVMSPFATHSWQTQTQCLSRGEFRLGPMTVTSTDPFGLFQLRENIAATSSIIVYPAIIQLSQMETPIGIFSGGEARRKRTHNITTNAFGVRDYVHGDSLNRIHWRTSARMNRLIVKEFELDPLVDIFLFVDLSQESLYEAGVERFDGDGAVKPPYQPIHTQGIYLPDSTEEYCVVIASSIANYFIESRRALGFAAYTPMREIHHPERGDRQLTRILRTLATARSKSPYSLARMLSLEGTYLMRGTTLIIVSASTDTEWIAEIQMLKRRGVKPICILVDPYSFGSLKSIDEVEESLQMLNVPTIKIGCQDDIASLLATPLQIR